MGRQHSYYNGAPKPREYVLFCEGKEIGDAPDPYAAANPASIHAKTNSSLMWHKGTVWRALHKGSLYEIRKLRVPRIVPGADEDIPKPRRHG